MASNVALPPCDKCGYLTGILNKIPPQNVPVELVRTNFVPDSQNYSKIQDLVSSSELSIRSLEAEVSNFKLVLPLLESRLSNIRKFKEFQHTLLAPIRRLPNEVLAEVFAYACSELINICFDRDTIWSLQQVCTRWRMIVRNIPRLWCRFKLGPMPAESLNVDEHIIALRVRTCLELSRTAPLTISFPPTPSCMPISPYSIYADIAKHWNRWFSLTADGDLLYYIMHTTRSSPMNDVRLEKLHDLTLQFSSEDDVYPELIDFDRTYPDFRSATALEEVRLVAMSYLPTFSDLFPWSKVRKLTLDHCTLAREEEAIAVFSALSLSLEELTWRNISYAYRPESQQVITLSSLHTITLEDWDTDPIWQMIRMPSLTAVRFIRDNIADLGRFVSTVQLSASIIKTIELMYCSVSFIYKVVEEFFNAQELSVTYSVGETSKHLSRLIWEPHPGRYVFDVENVLPSLQKLKLRNFSYEDASFMRSLKYVMHSRSATSAAEDDPTDLPRPEKVARPLLSVECRVEVSGVGDECFTRYFKKLGEELGIKTDIEMERISVHARL